MRFWVLILLLVIILPLSGKAQNQVPIIINNNPEKIDEYENPITLNWTVIDNDLQGYEIYQGKVMIANGSYNQTYEDKHNTIIELTFTLDQGEYNFTLIVWDSAGQFSSSSIDLLKGSQPPNLAEIPISNLWILGIILPVIYRSLKRSRPFRYHLE